MVAVVAGGAGVGAGAALKELKRQIGVATEYFAASAVDEDSIQLDERFIR